MVALVNCMVALGMFSTERAVRIESKPEPFFGYVNKNFIVQPSSPPEEFTKGQIKVFRIDQEGNRVLIDVPSDPRQRIWIEQDLIIEVTE